MRFTTVLLAAIVAASLVVWAQQTSSRQAGPTAKTSFAAMQANVAKIADAAEKERWQANTGMWQTKIGHPGKLDPANLAKQQASFDAMKRNVANITEPAEKERWQANCALWQVMLAQGDKPASADLDTMKASLTVLNANVARITSPSEKERWQANRDLWQTVVKPK